MLASLCNHFSSSAFKITVSCVKLSKFHRVWKKSRIEQIKKPQTTIRKKKQPKTEKPNTVIAFRALKYYFNI